MKTVIISLAILLLMPTVAKAAPSISEVSGSLTNGTDIFISGAGFGAHADNDAADPQKLNFAWNNFESGRAFQDGGDSGDGFVPDCDSVGCSADWQLAASGGKQNSSYWARRVDLSASSHDTFACNVHGLKKPSGYGAPYGNTAFISFYFKVPHTAASGKFYRQWTGSDAGTDVFYSGTGGADGYTIRTWDYNSNGTVLGDGIWQRIDYIQNGSTMDVYIVGQNGNQPEDTGTVSTSGYFQAVLGSGKDWGSGNDALANYYGYDDVFIDFTQARIELCDTSSWVARSRCELQIPKSWSPSQISAKVNQGSFLSGQQAYLYILDSTGAVNLSGYQVTIGGGGQADTTPPSAPTGLAVR